MFTDLYLTNVAATYTPATLRGAWDDTVAVVTKSLQPSTYQGGTIAQVFRVETNAAADYDLLLYRGITGPLAAQTISGTLDVRIGAQSNTTAANIHWHIHVYVTQGDSDTPRGTLLSDFTEALGVNEWSTSAIGHALNAAASLSSLAISAGDRIVVEIGAVVREASADARSAAIWYGTRVASTLSEAPDQTVGGNVLLQAAKLIFSNAITELDNTAYDSQVILESVDTDPSSTINDSDLALETVTGGTAPIRDSMMVLETVIARQAQANISQTVLEAIIRVVIPLCLTPDEGEDLCISAEDFVVFGYWLPGSQRINFAETTLPDDEDYYYGLKPDRLVGVSDISRRLSSQTWSYSASPFTVTLADDDFLLRTELCQAPGMYFTERDLTLFGITPEGRALLETAKTIADGVVDRDPTYDNTPNGVIVSLTCRDRIGSKFGWTTDGQTKIPRRVFTPDSLPGAPTSLYGLGVPFPYGRLGANVVASGVLTAPLESAGPVGLCGFLDAGAGDWRGGSQSMATPALTGLNMTTLAGGELSLEVPGTPDRYYGVVYPIGPDGTVYDPYPYCPNAGSSYAEVTSGNQQIRYDWPLHPDASRYLAYLCFSYFGIRPMQVIETTGLTCTFTKGPPVNLGYDVDLRPSTITPGAYVAGGTNFYYYRVRAKAGISRSEWTDTTGFIMSRFGTTQDGGVSWTTRPQRLWWEIVPTATAYEVQRRTASSDWQTQWTVASGQTQAGFAYFDERFNTPGGVTLTGEPEQVVGKYKPLYAGQVERGPETFHRWVIAGCAIKGVTSHYYNDGTNATEVNQDTGTVWYMPGRAEYVTLGLDGPYEDITGADGVVRRYCFAYGIGAKADLVASGTATLTVDLDGIERVGNGTGDVITGLYDQYEHVVNNLLLASGTEAYRTGDWVTRLRMGPQDLCVLDLDALNDVKTLREEAFGSEITGAGVVGAFGQRVDVAEELKRWQICGDFRVGSDRHWRHRMVALNRNFDATNVPLLDDEFDIQDRSFKVQSRLAEMFNNFTYRHSRNYVTDTWDADNQLYTNELSRERWRTLHDLDLSFYYLQDPDVVAYIFSEIVERLADAPKYITVEGPTCWMEASYDVGEYVRLKHWRGVGPNGYQNAPMWVMENTLLTKSRRVRLILQDLGELLPIPSGYAAVWSPVSVVDYATATEEERDLYGFWGDSNGRIPGTSLPAKVWG